MDGTTAPDVTPEQLHDIANAFARRDVDGIVNSFADDGEFRNAKGPDYWGQSFKGKAAIRGYFEPLFTNAGDVKWQHTSEFIHGNRAVTEWHRTATLKSGERQEWLGCDLYTFRRGLIVMKDTYIKVVG
ncbi:MAG: nuclear transport factor 2 family protein [Reyranella sp.]|uniref:nuclear transport factor 2 family protein n=1 Tax=Reyranella sp. TaxID=1929291 RepID=UPI00272FEF25|nr:nuclear transport factor 2 family protein [Reyranella sp.]MDP1961907.1 nuclear transport factor 2 family protein [Reyranella sp.]MDP2375601.1 nuclear transport factor 2 family protein [Reyranella sp.]